MPYDNLPDFLAHLQDDGELRRVSVQVDPCLEVTAIVDRICKQPGGGPALMFERVKGSPLPLVVNLLGSPSRILRALGVANTEELQDRLGDVSRSDAPESWFQKLKLGGTSSGGSLWKPQVVKTGMCQQVVKLGRDIDLRELPAVQAWPNDAGRFLYAGTVIGKDPRLGERFLETFPLQVLDRDTLGVYWHPHHKAFQYLQQHRRLGTHLPLAISFGGDPLWPFLAQAPIPPQMDPVGFGGFLRGKPMEMVRGRQVELEVPAGAEIVMEGYIDGQEAPLAGAAFSQGSGYYATPPEVPIFRVTTLTHRGNPVLVDNLPGRPPMENAALLSVNTQLAMPILKTMAPEIVSFRLLHESVNDQIGFVGIRKEFALQARKVIHALWGNRFTMFCKLIIAVDEDVLLEDTTEVWKAVASNVHPVRDVLFGEGPCSPWDHASPLPGVGSKLGVDATRKWATEGHSREWPEKLTLPDSVRDLVTRRWGEYQIDSNPRR